MARKSFSSSGAVKKKSESPGAQRGNLNLCMSVDYDDIRNNLYRSPLRRATIQFDSHCAY